MSKIYEVKSCIQCPHAVYMDGADLCDHEEVNYKNTGYRYAIDRDKQRINSHEFPIWCPLEDK